MNKVLTSFTEEQNSFSISVGDFSISPGILFTHPSVVNQNPKNEIETCSVNLLKTCKGI